MLVYLQARKDTNLRGTNNFTKFKFRRLRF